MPFCRSRGYAQPRCSLALAFQVWGRMLACWPWVWVASFTLASGLAQILPHLGLALSSAPLDHTHRLWPFFLDPWEGVQSCDSCVLPGAQAEGFQLALREVACQPPRNRGWRSGSPGSWHIVCAGRQDDKRGRAWWLRSPKGTGDSPEGPQCSRYTSLPPQYLSCRQRQSWERLSFNSQENPSTNVFTLMSDGLPVLVLAGPGQL